MTDTVKDFASPNGPILLLSAKGLTTAGIAEANGVKDFSGNENHGQAYGTTTVNASNDEFVFDGSTASKIEITNSTFLSKFNGKTKYTLSIEARCDDNNRPRTGGFINNLSTGYLFGFFLFYTNSVAFEDRMSSSSETIKKFTATISSGVYHTCTATVDYSKGEAILYVDGIEVAKSNSWFTGTKANITAFRLGQSSATTNYNFVGPIKNVRVYDRVLSAAEVKYLYNGFQPNIIVGQSIPSGAILDLSARGLTTSGIAQTDGVVDRSGNMNAGTAYGGISIVNDSSLGECFSFDGSDDYMEFNKSSFMNAFSNIQGLTVAFKMKPNNVSGKDIVLFEGFYDEATTLFAVRLYQGKINYYVRRKISDSWVTYSSSLSITQDGVYRVAALFDWQNEKVSLYIDGTLDSTYDTSFGAGNLLNSPTFIWLGKHSKVNRCYRGLLTDVLVYPRALTASEVQQLADASLKKIRGINMGSNLVKHIYYGRNLIYAKTKDYSLPKTFTRTQLSQTTLSSPSRAAFISPAGNMFATDWSGKCVKIFDSTGTYVRSFTPLSGKIPYGINGDASYLYVTYWDSPKIYKYQYSGTDVPTLKDTWTTSHQYNDGTDVYNGYLYVACASDHVIMKIDVSSGTVTEIATGMTYSLNDLSIDKVNSRIVTTQNGGEYNGTKGHLVIYDMSGTLLVDKEMNGTYASKMDSPQGVVVDADGCIYLGGAYTSTGSYNQGFMVMDKDLNILYDLTQSECPTFCYTFNYDSYHNRVVWVGTSYGGSNPYIYGIDL